MRPAAELAGGWRSQMKTRLQWRSVPLGGPGSYFLASKHLPQLTKWRICKLLFLADKLHLLRYGRPITGDAYYAMKLGPVPTNVLNVLDNAQRLASTMAELRSFYDAILPRIDAILAYLNDFRLDRLPAEAQALLHLSLSLAEVAPAVELFGQPEVPDGYDSRRITVVEH
jgi:Protein of unknown function (DUF4065)